MVLELGLVENYDGHIGYDYNVLEAYIGTSHGVHGRGLKSRETLTTTKNMKLQ